MIHTYFLYLGWGRSLICFLCFIFCSFFLFSSPSPAKPVSEPGHWTGQHHRRLSRAWPGGDAHTHGTDVRLYFCAFKDEDGKDLETTSLSQTDLLSMSWINNLNNLYIRIYVFVCVCVYLLMYIFPYFSPTSFLHFFTLPRPLQRGMQAVGKKPPLSTEPRPNAILLEAREKKRRWSPRGSRSSGGCRDSWGTSATRPEWWEELAGPRTACAPRTLSVASETRWWSCSCRTATPSSATVLWKPAAVPNSSQRSHVEVRDQRNMCLTATAQKHQRRQKPEGGSGPVSLTAVSFAFPNCRCFSSFIPETANRELNTLFSGGGLWSFRIQHNTIQCFTIHSNSGPQPPSRGPVPVRGSRDFSAISNWGESCYNSMPLMWQK